MTTKSGSGWIKTNPCLAYSSPRTQRHAALYRHRTCCADGSLQRFGDFRSAAFFFCHRLQRTQIVFRPRATNLLLLLSQCLIPFLGVERLASTCGKSKTIYFFTIDQSAGFAIRPLPLHSLQRGGKILLPGGGCSTTGSTPVPLQAGQTSSLCFGSFRLTATQTSGEGYINYTLKQLRNQLSAVTLSGLVKLSGRVGLRNGCGQSELDSHPARIAARLSSLASLWVFDMVRRTKSVTAPDSGKRRQFPQ
jgi:hypothetical protein